MKNNWKPVIESLINIVTNAGFVITSIDNGDGEEIPKSFEETVDMIVATDSSDVYLKKNGKIAWMYIVLGNEPEETVCDYNMNAELEAAVDLFSDEWTGVSWPTIK